MSLSKDTIENRLTVLDEDIIKVQQNIKNLEQQRIEMVGMLNALTGARQQCQNFLKEFSDDEPEASDSSDVE
tara:strand:- start:93 stop:308 length:216 start_codon:yes stop_codon:yes gene_type:complete